VSPLSYKAILGRADVLGFDEEVTGVATVLAAVITAGEVETVAVVGVGLACTSASGCGAGVCLSAGAVAHPTKTRLKIANGAKARLPVNPTINSHPRRVNVHRFRNVTVLG